MSFTASLPAAMSFPTPKHMTYVYMYIEVARKQNTDALVARGDGDVDCRLAGRLLHCKYDRF